MKGKHAQKNFSAVGAMAPTPLSLKTQGGGGGLGGVAYKDRARPPPRGVAKELGMFGIHDDPRLCNGCKLQCGVRGEGGGRGAEENLLRPYNPLCPPLAPPPTPPYPPLHPPPPTPPPLPPPYLQGRGGATSCDICVCIGQNHGLVQARIGR